jgi:hypothetical protein
LLIGLILSGCASNNRAPLPDWTEARQEWGEVSDATDLPLLCDIPWTAAECWSALDVYEDIAEGNKELANLQADALRKVIGAYDAAISAGELQQQVSEIYRELYEEERTEHFWTKTTYRVVFGLGAAVAIGVAL